MRSVRLPLVAGPAVTTRGTIQQPPQEPTTPPSHTQTRAPVARRPAPSPSIAHSAHLFVFPRSPALQPPRACQQTTDRHPIAARMPTCPPSTYQAIANTARPFTSLQPAPFAGAPSQSMIGFRLRLELRGGRKKLSIKFETWETHSGALLWSCLYHIHWHFSCSGTRAFSGSAAPLA